MTRRAQAARNAVALGGSVMFCMRPGGSRKRWEVSAGRTKRWPWVDLVDVLDVLRR